MPKCSRCGSYFIRPPCPVCSPPGVEQLVEDSPEVKGKSVDELQSDLKQLQETFKNKESEFDTRTEELKTRLDKINNQISDLEFSKVSSVEKKRSLEKEISDFADELNSVKLATEELERERHSLLNNIQKAEEQKQSYDSEISVLKEKIEHRQHEEEQHRQREEEQRRQREEEQHRQREEEQRRQGEEEQRRQREEEERQRREETLKNDSNTETNESG
ncbi:MAG: hypothetical protein JSU57_03960 [Candidatus Heimdallarchaeota archaeon]|nr:MAG: hypothetical protein JSU57_03960 [Candidatus Heimdallarchaeota archaeon]